MAAVRRAGVWFMGWMVAFAVIVYLFSSEAFVLLINAAGLTDLASGLEWPLQYYLWLAVGFALVVVVSRAAVRRWGCPASVWVVALANAVIVVLRLALVPVKSWLLGLAGAPSDVYAPGELMVRLVAASPFAHVGLYAYVGIALGHVAAMGLGCWLGARGLGVAGTHLTSASS